MISDCLILYSNSYIFFSYNFLIAYSLDSSDTSYIVREGLAW